MHPLANVPSNNISRQIQQNIQWHTLVLISFIFLFSCAKDDRAATFEIIDISYITARELPKNPTELKILAIGNSFTDDAMTLFPNLLDSSHIYNVTLGKLTYGGAALDTHLINYLQNAHAYTFEVTKENHWEKISDNYTISEGVSFLDWDIIILQQVSRLSGQIQSYQPYLNQLIKMLDDNCSNKNVVFGWHMTWAYAQNYTNSDFKNYGYNQWNMYTKIVETVEDMQAQTGIQLVIPSGTAIQNLRNTSLNDSMDLTRDGCHITLGVGRYTLACTWFQSLISPILGVDLLGNNYRESNGIKVTDDNYAICQQAAIQACNDKFEVSQ